jgi:beta-lactamase class A
MARTLVIVVVAIASLGACRDGAADRPVPTASRSSTSTIATTTSTGSPQENLQTVVESAATGQAVTVSVVALNLATGERGAHLGTRVVWSASLYKLFVARELYRRIAAGSLRQDAPSGDGEHTVEECLRLMIVVSDDGCGVAGLNMVGRGRLDASLHADGFPGTFLDTPQRTTAADVVELFRRERAGATALYGLLGQQQVNDRIPPALPPGTPLAHKTGDRTGWAHDAGVITTPKGDVIVAVLTGPWPAPCCHEERIGPLERQAFTLIGSVARRVYEKVAS